MVAAHFDLPVQELEKAKAIILRVQNTVCISEFETVYLIEIAVSAGKRAHRHVYRLK